MEPIERGDPLLPTWPHCPFCGSDNVRVVRTPSRPRTVLSISFTCQECYGSAMATHGDWRNQ